MNAMLEVVRIPVLNDNYVWLVHDAASGQTMVVDPSVAEPVLAAAAERGWVEAERMIHDPGYALVILDELNLVLKYGYLELARVLATFSTRRPELHLVVTGRHAPAALVELADLVSEIRAIKHPYREQGVKAQRGIEF